MAIQKVTGDILASECQVIAVTTNCVGVMGAGLAKQARERYPGMYHIYRWLHGRGSLRVDRPDLIRDPESNRLFLLFPTKKHYRDPSEYHWVENNLQWMVANHPDGDLRGVTSVALPALGCGLGGLRWESVEYLIEKHLTDMDLDIHLYPPHNTGRQPLGE